MKMFCYLAGLFCVLIMSGCASSDVLTVSDLTVEELESKMAAKVDASGNYRKSKSFIFRQTIKTPQFLDDDIENMVETKMVLPDKFRITTLQDNEPVQIICSNGSKAWLADTASKKLRNIEGEKLQQLLTLSKLAIPAFGYRNIFKKVEIFRCSNDDGEFYLLKCVGNNENTFNIYVDASDFLLRRMSGRMKLGVGHLEYDSRIKSYGLYNGVMIPKVTETRQNGLKQVVEVISYELDPVINQLEFLPPVF
ncbi:MAG: hypothetical protein E7042_07440 [Lentisphaerae bacterium]|nr:hypothetical protein [Lentisphaerota bacterium]